MKSPTTTTRPRRGFTLAETLVALALFVMAVAVLGSAANNALIALHVSKFNQGREQDYSAVRKVVLTLPTLDEMELGGDVPLPNGGRASWSAVVTPTTTVDLYRVDLTVTLEGDSENASQESTRAYYLLRPAWAQGQAQERDALLAERKEQLSQRRTAQIWP